jgi:hypothetical protein
MLEEKSEVGRVLAVPGFGSEDNIKMHPRERGCEDVYWIDMAQGRDWRQDLVNTATNLRVPYKTVYFLTRLVTTSLSVMTLAPTNYTAALHYSSQCFSAVSMSGILLSDSNSTYCSIFVLLMSAGKGWLSVLA